MEGLRRAAQSGSIDALYASIQGDPNVLRQIDQMDFVDTPLHIAAAAGHDDFAMEMMNLKPSFARKLNQRGLSPIHLALQNEKEKMVIDLLSVDKDLVRVKGREGYTALHVVARDGNVPLLSQFLEQCPDCILDLTIRKETALHIAARNETPEAFEAILQCIQRNQFLTTLNFQDKEGNTVLHIAASRNQTQMIKLLTECKEVNKKVLNEEGLTALEVLKRQTQYDRESENILCRTKDSKSGMFEASKFNRKLTRDIAEMKPETINALLVVSALILTMTYQALLSPPGSVFQGDASLSTTDQKNAGRTVMNPVSFLLFFTANGIAFSLAMSITIFLVSVVAKSIMPFLFLLSLLMTFCYSTGMSAIGPPPAESISWVAGLLPFIIFLLIYYIPLYRFRKH